MGCMGEHIYWLNRHYTILGIKILKVACLGGWVATHIHDALGSSPQNGLHHIGVHTSTWWIGDDYIGASVLSDEVVSSMASGTYSIPITCRAFFATKLAMVPVPV